MSANKQSRMIRLPKAALNQRKKRYMKPTSEAARYVPANNFKSWRDKNVVITNGN